MLRPILLTSAKVPNDLEIYPTLNVGLSDLSGAISTVKTSDLTANRALISNGSGKIAASSVTSTQLGYVSGVTSAIQTQLNNKAALDSPTFTGTPKAPTASAGTNTT